MLDIVLMERHEEFISDLGHEPRAPASAGHERCHGSPRALVLTTQERKAHLQPALIVRVVHARHFSGHYALHLAHCSSCRLVTSPMRLALNSVRYPFPPMVCVDDSTK